MTRRLVVALAAVMVAWSVLAPSLAAQAGSADPVLGAWKLNVERSVWSPGPRPPADLIQHRQYAMLEGGWMRFTDTSINAIGAPAFAMGVFKLDGQRHPVHNIATLGPLMSSGRASNIVRSYRVIDPRTTESITYTDGVAGVPVVRAVSANGREIIETTRGTNPQGVAVNNVLVWDRVN